MCRSIAVLPICSSAAPSKARQGLPNKGQVFRKIGRRKLVPYYDRAEIEDGAIAGRGLEICWLKDQTDLLFTQIQGSARVLLEDGSTVRINYDAHNGYPYTAVGRILIERNIIPRDQMSMQKIREWMEQNPDGAKELRRQNRSYVFFREVQLSDKDEAVGAQGVPLTPGRSIAVDKALHVYGTPFFIEGELPIESAQSKTPFRRLMIAQDTGSAIVGPARADLYFGAGARCRQGVRPPPPQCALRHSGAEEPRSGGARPQDAGAGCAAVGENRKTVSANRSVEGPGQGSEERCQVTGRYRDNRTKAVLRRRHRPRPGLRKPRHSGRRREAGAAAGAAAASSSRFLQSPTSVISAAIATSDETPAVELDSRIAGAAAAQAWPQRGGARVVGERRQAGQAAAQTTPRAEAASGFAGSGNKVGAKPAASPRHVAPPRIALPPKPEPPPLAPIGRRERSQLSRGRKEIDARLDLHGMTQTRAHRALFGFLQRAHHDGLTFVLVITGKGKIGAESERGVLRRQVPQWLGLPEFRSLVVGFEEAHIGHGGEGALYVRVRRARTLRTAVRFRRAGSASRSSQMPSSSDRQPISAVPLSKPAAS